MIYLNKLLVLIILPIFLIACSEDIQVKEYPYDAVVAETSVLAVVGQDKIYRAELDHLLAFHSTNPTSSSSEEKEKILQEMINDQIMYKKAVENGFDQDPEFIINQRKLLAYEYKKYLAKKIAKNAKVTELDIKLHYEKNQEQYSKPAMFRIALYLRRDDLEKEYKYSLKQIAESAGYLEADEGFGQFAKSSAHLATQYRGGKLSWMTQETTVSGIPSIVFSNIADLEIGEVSAVIEADKNKYIVRLISKRDKETIPLSDVKAEIRKKLLSDTKNTALIAYLSKAKDTYNVEVYTEQLKASQSKLSSEHSFGPPGFPAN